MTDENNDELNADIPEDAQSPQQSTDAVPNGEVADAELATHDPLGTGTACAHSSTVGPLCMCSLQHGARHPPVSTVSREQYSRLHRHFLRQFHPRAYPF